MTLLHSSLFAASRRSVGVLALTLVALLLIPALHAQTTQVTAWGDNFVGQRDVPDGLTGVTDVAAGDLHTVALKDDGTVVAWGDNLEGQTSVPDGLANVTDVAGGGRHTVAVKDDGTVVAWGYNVSGQTDVPDGLTGVTDVAAGVSHTVALKDDGTVVAWGYNLSGQTDVPDGLTGVTAIDAGREYTVALKNDGTVVAWGANVSGQTNVPDGLTGVTIIAAGGFHAVALSVTNQPPVADAGDDQTVIAGQMVALDGTRSSDPDGDELTFAWTLASAPLSGADTASPMFCAADAGAYTAELVVNDGMAGSDPDEVTVTALSVDDAIAVLIADIEVVLSRRDARALTNRLTQALRHLGRGRSADAMFRTVRTRIGTYVRIGKLTQEQADELTGSLDAITGTLASPCSDTAAVHGDDRIASATIQAEAAFGLAAPYPNPTSGRATVAFSIEDATDVRLSVYDALGREVAVLMEGTAPSGRHELAFDGAELVAGTYLVRLTTADGRVASHRLTLLR